VEFPVALFSGKEPPPQKNTLDMKLTGLNMLIKINILNSPAGDSTKIVQFIAIYFNEWAVVTLSE
jgi:hypothetical protein